MAPSRQERFVGSLLGLVVGDALGAKFEGRWPAWIAKRYGSVDELVTSPPGDLLHYTDDGQMAIGVAQTLVEKGEIDEETLVGFFVENYVPHRGYGMGAQVVLEAMEEGRDYRDLAANYFPGGSFGNGGAMRVGPVGVFFSGDRDRLWEQARLQSLPTHVHPLGVEGAQLLALAVGWAAEADTWDRDDYWNVLREREVSPEYQAKLEVAAQAKSVEDLRPLGCGIAALDSVPTAMALFSLVPEDYVQVVGQAIFLGGDTDTIAAMGGAISGAFLGDRAIPSTWRDRLENHSEVYGRDFVVELGKRLCRRWETDQH